MVFTTGASTTIDETSGSQNDDTNSNVKVSVCRPGQSRSDPDMGNAAIFARFRRAGQHDLSARARTIGHDAAVAADEHRPGAIRPDHDRRPSIYLFQVSDSWWWAGSMTPRRCALRLRSTTGRIAQYPSLHHDDDADPDDQVDLRHAVAVVSVTDYDGDTVTATSIGD
jgi:hypothetical protein